LSPNKHQIPSPPRNESGLNARPVEVAWFGSPKMVIFSPGGWSWDLSLSPECHRFNGNEVDALESLHSPVSNLFPSFKMFALALASTMTFRIEHNLIPGIARSLNPPQSWFPNLDLTVSRGLLGSICWKGAVYPGDNSDCKANMK
jgi:hypothetical protein